MVARGTKRLINRRNDITQGWKLCIPFALGKEGGKKKKNYYNTGYLYLVTHPCTFRNIPEHGIIIAIMTKLVKLNFQQLNETKINWYQLGKLKETKTEQNKSKT